MRATDRLSVTVSVLLLGGLLLATLATALQERLRRPASSHIAPEPVAAPPSSPARPRAIRLPPPPAPPEHRPAAPARIVEPLQVPLPAKIVPTPRPAARPRPKATTSEPPEPESPDRATPVIDAAARRRTGGALLRLLEHGKGPTIEIAWPGSASERRALFHNLTRCYGMRGAVIDDASRLFAADTSSGKAWTIDRDRFSGFLRSPQGEAIPEEARAFVRIARRHGLSGWRPVRVFPRDVDASLLGGLEQLLGQRYRTARSIRAAYDPGGRGLRLTGFRVDGASIPGAIALAPHRPGCR